CLFGDTGPPLAPPPHRLVGRGMFLELAERLGFEPRVGFKPTHAFQACALSHSAISPANASPLWGSRQRYAIFFLAQPVKRALLDTATNRRLDLPLLLWRRGLGRASPRETALGLFCHRVCAHLPNPLPALRWRGEGEAPDGSVKRPMSSQHRPPRCRRWQSMLPSSR